MPALFLINGPNLNLLGEREPEIYGTTTLADCVALAESATLERGWSFSSAQFNSEGEMIEAIHSARTAADAIVINPGAFTHYSWALHDALAAFEGPVIELHLSNPDAREPWRRTSVVAPVATGTIAGFGGDGYRLAIAAVARLLDLG